MSFHISFTVGDKYSALRKLQDAHAPASVKAVIEKALDHLRERVPLTLQGGMSAGTVATNGQDAAKARAAESLPDSSPLMDQPCGVAVEAWGHIDVTGFGESRIERFIVKPIFE